MDKKQFNEAKKQHEKNQKKLSKKSIKLLTAVERVKECDDEEYEQILDIILGDQIKIVERDEIFIMGVEEGLKISKEYRKEQQPEGGKE